MRDDDRRAFEDSEAIEDGHPQAAGGDRRAAARGESGARGIRVGAAEGRYDAPRWPTCGASRSSLDARDLACEEKHIAPVEEAVRKEKETQFRERTPTAAPGQAARRLGAGRPAGAAWITGRAC